MKRKKIYFLIAFFFFKTVTLNAQVQFDPGDIVGLWQCTKSGNDIILEISGENGVVRSIGSSKLPKSLVGGFMYMNIKFDQIEKKLWVAQKNVWKSKEDDNTLPVTGRWIKAEMLTFKMSDDKNNFTAYGDLTFKRLSKKIDTPKKPDDKIGSKDCYTEEFGGVTGCFTILKGAIVARFSYPNSVEDDNAIILVKTEDHVLQKISLYHEQEYTGTFKGNSIEVQVLHSKGLNPENEKSIMNKIIDFIKGQVRLQVTKDYLKIKTKKINSNVSFGVRGR